MLLFDTDDLIQEHAAFYMHPAVIELWDGFYLGSCKKQTLKYAHKYHGIPLSTIALIFVAVRVYRHVDLYLLIQCPAQVCTRHVGVGQRPNS